MLEMLELAAQAARPDVDKQRRACVGAVAIRADGAVVRARNGSAAKVSPSCHAEARVVRKCGRGAEVFVARVLKDGTFAMARPCSRCRAVLRSKGIKYVTYSVGAASYMTEAL